MSVRWSDAATVACGVVVGTAARAGLLAASSNLSAVWTVMAINVVGAFLLGVVVTKLGGRARRQRFGRNLLGGGFLGGFTTYSTLAVSTLGLIDAHTPFVGAAYGLATATAGVAAAVGGALVRWS